MVLFGVIRTAAEGSFLSVPRARVKCPAIRPTGSCAGNPFRARVRCFSAPFMMANRRGFLGRWAPLMIGLDAAAGSDVLLKKTQADG